MAIEPCTLGPNVPLVTFPINLSFWSNIFVFSLAIAFVSGLMPTLIYSTPSSISFFIILDPGKLELILFLDIAHFKFASIGLIFSFKSCPYKHKHASNLRVSLAPRPINFDPFFNKISTKLSTLELSIEISKPSSPVYPDLVI